MPRSLELKHLDVVVGIVTDDRDRVLIQQRDDGPFAGLWEFPGGKRESGETYPDALARELAEENAITVRDSRPLIRVVHRYPDRVVTLNTFEVTSYDGDVQAAEGQPIRWVSRRGLLDEPMLPADRPISVAVNLPDTYLVTPGHKDEAPFLAELERSLAAGVRLACLRVPGLDDAAYERLARLAVARCEHHGAELLLHGTAARVPLVREVGAAGLHLTASAANALSTRPLDQDRWLAVSTHTPSELESAHRLGADFATLGTVSPTPSHPGDPVMGWEGFAALALEAHLPVYGIGGLGLGDVAQARASGGQGVAAIRGLWTGGSGAD
ncbi:MAG: Nudix family hydrolase [Pseudomonadota bacterium]